MSPISNGYVVALDMASGDLNQLALSIGADYKNPNALSQYKYLKDNVLPEIIQNALSDHLPQRIIDGLNNACADLAKAVGQDGYFTDDSANLIDSAKYAISNVTPQTHSVPTPQQLDKGYITSLQIAQGDLKQLSQMLGSDPKDAKALSQFDYVQNWALGELREMTQSDKLPQNIIDGLNNASDTLGKAIGSDGYFTKDAQTYISQAMNMIASLLPTKS